MTKLLLPPGYRPRENDVDPDDANVLLEIAGAGPSRIGVRVEDLAGVFSYGWKVGDLVRSTNKPSDVGRIIALYDRMVWVKRELGSFGTYAITELEPVQGTATLGADPT